LGISLALLQKENPESHPSVEQIIARARSLLLPVEAHGSSSTKTVVSPSFECDGLSRMQAEAIKIN